MALFDKSPGAMRRFVVMLSLGLVVLTFAEWIRSFVPFDGVLNHNGVPFGGDFGQFFAAGEIVRDAPEKLYDLTLQQQVLHAAIPKLAPQFYLPFWYPPALAVLFAPISQLPYLFAAILFTLLSVGCVCAAVAMAREYSPALRAFSRGALVIAALGFPAVTEAVIGGQLSVFGMAIAVAAIALIYRRNFTLAGIVLCAGLYKPNLLLFFIAALLLRFPALLRGFLPALGCGAALSWWLVGHNELLRYLRSLVFAASMNIGVAPPHKVMGIGSLLALVDVRAAAPIALLLGAAAVVMLVRRWRAVPLDDRERSALFFAAALTASLIGNPYLPLYDLALVAVVIGLLADCRRLLDASSRFLFLGVLVLFLFPHLSQAWMMMTGAQLFPLALIALGVFVARAVGRATAASAG